MRAIICSRSAWPFRSRRPTNARSRRLRQRRAEREAHEFNTMTELAKGVAKLICVIKVKAGEDGKMFGSVTAGMIADELKHQFDISLDKRKIHLEHPIRDARRTRNRIAPARRGQRHAQGARRKPHAGRGAGCRRQRMPGRRTVEGPGRKSAGGTPKVKRPEKRKLPKPNPRAEKHAKAEKAEAVEAKPKAEKHVKVEKAEKAPKAPKAEKKEKKTE